MKKLFKLFIAMMAVILPLASCSDDDSDKDKDINLAKSFKSEYVGDLTISINGESTEPTKETVLISSKEKNTIDLSLKNFMLVDEETTMPVGNIDIEGIKLTGSKDEVIFMVSQDIMLKEGDAQGVDMWLGPMICADGPIPVAITGTLTNGKLDINITIDLEESLGQKINVNFKG